MTAGLASSLRLIHSCLCATRTTSEAEHGASYPILEQCEPKRSALHILPQWMNKWMTVKSGGKMTIKLERLLK